MDTNLVGKILILILNKNSKLHLCRIKNNKHAQKALIGSILLFYRAKILVIPLQCFFYKIRPWN